MVNNKGYLRTLEAIIAILLVFGFLLTVLPKTGDVDQKESHLVPTDLDLTATAFLTELERNEVFRSCVLNDDASNIITESEIVSALGSPLLQVDGLDGASSLDCVYSFLKSNLPPFTVWDFSFSLCDADENCLYFPLTYWDEEITDFVPVQDISHILPSATNVYPKSIFMGTNDIIAQPVEVSALSESLTSNDAFSSSSEDVVTLFEIENPPEIEDVSVVFSDSASLMGQYDKVLRIYFWESD